MKANKKMIRSEFEKVWGNDQRMVDYCTSKAATMAVLPGGGIVTVDKQGIEKDFCYGESGYDMDDAIRAADRARTSEDHFLWANMKWHRGWISDLEDAKVVNGTWRLFIQDTHYIGQREDCLIRDIQFVRTTDVLDVTGPAFLEELAGKRMTIKGMTGHLATIEEINLIEDAYKEAAADHEKKVRSYLKRYGTSKVHAWTYWRDA